MSVDSASFWSPNVEPGARETRRDGPVRGRGTLERRPRRRWVQPLVADDMGPRRHHVVPISGRARRPARRDHEALRVVKQRRRDVDPPREGRGHRAADRDEVGAAPYFFRGPVGDAGPRRRLAPQLAALHREVGRRPWRSGSRITCRRRVLAHFAFNITTPERLRRIFVGHTRLSRMNKRPPKFLVCRYARSLGLAARQNTPAIDAAIYRPNGTSYQLQPSFHTQSTEPEPTARARRAGEEFY